MTAPETSRPAKRLCILGLGSGGHHSQIERLTRGLPADWEFVLLYVIDSQVEGTWNRLPLSQYGKAANKTRPLAGVYVVRSPSLMGDSRFRKWCLTVFGFFKGLGVLLATRPDALVAVGSAQAVPVGLAARLLGVPLYFVESITRVHRLSATGRAIHRYRLAKRFFVQWPQLAKKYPGTEYAGRILELAAETFEPASAQHSSSGN